MTARVLPRYPVFVPSKGRAERCLTAKMLDRDGVPFQLVVEPQERDAYAAKFGAARVLVLPFANQGSVIPARNWIKEHSTAEGHARHWQLDDNISTVYRYVRKRIRCASGVALRVCEDFTERYTNVAVPGLNYTMFAYGGTAIPPFYRNIRVYSCALVLNSLPHRWRGRYNEDTDLCLQVLADGWCTLLLNAFLVQKAATMTMEGGNTAELYAKKDGRLKMARNLERLWPGVVTTKRRFQRPQHVVKDAWRRFDTELIPRPDLVGQPAQDYGIKLRQVREAIKSPTIQRLLDDFGN